MAKMSSPLTLLFIFLSYIMINHLHVVSCKTWCVVTSTVTDAQLETNINFGCKLILDCRRILPGGSCYVPNTLKSHASFVMNSYYQSHDRTKEACSFNNTGRIVTRDPSYGRCKYES
ncbi:PREDICTED: glucan endo-1,3-beta-glucosidase-like [Camelina sativa]|uniref:Glucan endo-1,3-beta-glucosidase-like n=1 Tax=Camelina sativa TaxID=90675 RepID=A0ABM0U4N6_CAMSA|nr:PREDICTED: glucan endo-1,3-beta-glucosidase-like [Camelina sativa]